MSCYLRPVGRSNKHHQTWAVPRNKDILGRHPGWCHVIPKLRTSSSMGFFFSCPSSTSKNKYTTLMLFWWPPPHPPQTKCTSHHIILTMFMGPMMFFVHQSSLFCSINQQITCSMCINKKHMIYMIFNDLYLQPPRDLYFHLITISAWHLQPAWSFWRARLPPHGAQQRQHNGLIGIGSSVLKGCWKKQRYLGFKQHPLEKMLA